ncbi:MAG: folylpolyglutamate synthase/dihydrofolate synthase family protein [Blautia sp.]|uniref:bifunctional folylpolyglutamate synthase/dihydrofolate synthase n=1 Tax=Blautia sp. TaxID=1955243 RepID=UPI002A755491|nr:folylpolyglutamate synthase/dihydrofolate synthase family protein [Blautia sp.]MDY3016709.1 folylpolyglutamate synthase/dihydrofolate synthase family protein [Blautia sp.]
MNYEEAREYLDQVSKGGSVLGLDNMRELLKRLENPQDSLKFVHISGTNGKGSVLAYVSTVFKEAGYRTGRYISPTLFSYREKIQVNERFIGREDLARLTAKVKKAAEEMKNSGKGSPTIFEIETALAFLYFVEQKCDIVILETGLGGALDATNVITTSVMEVITSISMDHMEFLGDTLGKIALQKAGIIKPHTAVVSAMQETEAAEVILDVCRKKECICNMVDPKQIEHISYGCDGQSFSYKNWDNIKISLMGSYQIKNAALALEAIEALRELGYQLNDNAVYQGMKKAVWKGRFTIISKEPFIIMDGAHNQAAAEELVRSLKLYYPGKKFYYIFGMFRDKDYHQVIRLTAPLAEYIITVETPENPRALPAEELKKAVAEVNPSVEAAGSLRMAVNQVMEQIDKDAVIVIFGSLSFLGEAEMAVNRYKMEVGD